MPLLLQPSYTSIRHMDIQIGGPQLVRRKIFNFRSETHCLGTREGDPSILAYPGHFFFTGRASTLHIVVENEDIVHLLLAFNLLALLAAYVRNVISGSRNRSDSRPDRGRLSCMAVGPLSRSTTIKGGQAGAREPTFTVPIVLLQTLTT
jgi:hypothetical protein